MRKEICCRGAKQRKLANGEDQEGKTKEKQRKNLIKSRRGERSQAESSHARSSGGEIQIRAMQILGPILRGFFADRGFLGIPRDRRSNLQNQNLFQHLIERFRLLEKDSDKYPSSISAASHADSLPRRCRRRRTGQIPASIII